MQSQRSQAKAYNKNVDLPVPDETQDNVTFKDGTSRIVEHAVAMKLYNGSSKGYYCAWNGKAWKFNRTNNLGFNYVERVCSEVP